ncbi:hypothetical protein [Saccharicrinis aurantiacus]|uniref:hypothetical protein n=1 Tax=Saccharicrinis aurantiacus TaxID=1849719 RepID=UPI0024938F46|nr:hypothetical protein [Saccharicrinis aurantiacus]
MNTNLNHRPAILIGCLLWIASFYGELYNYQPYSTIGLISAPIITLFGIFHWFKYYKATRGHYPKFLKIAKELNRKMRKNPFTGISFMFKHLLKTWTFAIIGWMGMVLMGFLIFENSNAFKTAKHYCENNTVIKEQTGNISYYGILVSGGITNSGETGESDLLFTIVAENGNFKANVNLLKTNNNWEVLNCSIDK